MRTPRKVIFPQGQSVTVHIRNRAVRRWFIFGSNQEEFSKSQAKAFLLEYILWRLAYTWQVSVLAFNFLRERYQMKLHFDPSRIDALCDRRIAELVADLDVKSEARGRMSPEEREQWIQDLLSNPDELKKWRNNLKDPSMFMQYFDEGVSKKMNKLDNEHGTMWEDRFDATVSVGAEGVLSTMLDVDLAQIREGRANNLERCRHSSIYYRLLDVESLPEEQRDHARRMKALLCPLEEVYAECGFEHEPLNLEDYLELLRIEGCMERPGQGTFRQAPKELLLRYGLRLESIGEMAREAFAKCVTFIGKPNDILTAGRLVGRNMQRAALAASVLFCRH